MGKRRPLKDRFHEKYEVVEPGGCWVWMASIGANGYGQLQANGRPDGAHRISWKLHKGEIPSGLCVLHRCDNPPCVNPDHLFIGTQGENQADKAAKGRSASGEKNGGSKLTESDVRAIRNLAKTMTHKKIAKRFGVSRQTISLIVGELSWVGV